MNNDKDAISVVIVQGPEAKGSIKFADIAGAPEENNALVEYLETYVNGRLEAYMNEHLEAMVNSYLETYANDNWKAMVNSYLETYMNEHLETMVNSYLETYMNEHFNNIDDVPL